jgi:D-arabinose 1-dehydrogenase-like Zn-dependent alcohol dehydrogenase
LGHLAIQFAAKSGFNVVALSQSDSKKELATKLGAHHYLSGKDVVRISQAVTTFAALMSVPLQTDQLQKKFGGAALIMCTAPNPEVITSYVQAM